MKYTLNLLIVSLVFFWPWPLWRVRKISRIFSNATGTGDATAK